MIQTVVVGDGLAGRNFHVPLLRRQPGIRIHRIVARDPKLRAEAEATEGVVGYPNMATAMADPDVDLVVIATTAITRTSSRSDDRVDWRPRRGKPTHRDMF